MVLIRRLVEPAKGGEILLFIQARVDKKDRQSIVYRKGLSRASFTPVQQGIKYSSSTWCETFCFHMFIHNN